VITRESHCHLLHSTMITVVLLARGLEKSFYLCVSCTDWFGSLRWTFWLIQCKCGWHGITALFCVRFSSWSSPSFVFFWLAFSVVIIRIGSMILLIWCDCKNWNHDSLDLMLRELLIMSTNSNSEAWQLA